MSVIQRDLYYQLSRTYFQSNMHSSLNYRQSRRSACDRCRGFKLRCERDQVNGRSCERCLKAQVGCTTSVGQSAPRYIPSKSGSSALSQDCDRVVTREGTLMPALHRSTASKVRKPLGSPGTPRRQDPRYSNYWKIPELLPSLPAANFSSMDNIGLAIPLLSSSAFHGEPCGDPYTSSGMVSNEFVSPIVQQAKKKTTPFLISSASSPH